MAILFSEEKLMKNNALYFCRGLKMARERHFLAGDSFRGYFPTKSRHSLK